MVCISPKCGDDEIILKDGSCKLCPKLEKPDDSQRQCVKRVCGIHQKLNDRGECIIPVCK